MSPIKRGDIYYIQVPLRSGGVKLRTAETSEKRVYTLTKALVARLKANRRWKLLEAVTKKPQRLTLGQLYDADQDNVLDALEASLSAQALKPLMAKYLEDCTARGLAPRNVENITRQLAHFYEWMEHEGLANTTADLTSGHVTRWLGSLTTTPGTRRQYLFAVTGFTRYLVRVDVLATYPLSKVEAPKKNAARERYETIENDERIVRAASEEMRGLFAFVKGTGCDLTTAINTPAREINLATGTARLKGTKTAKRDVHKALIESWAIPYLRAALHGVMANAKPWAAITRSRAAKHHAACCEAVEIEGYTLKDARHSVAVRMLEAGYDIYAVAEQLGNTPELVARVYGQHQPKMAHKVTESVTEAAK